ncbi:hypothetical protein AB4282_18985 [Vibrio lentus]
MRSIRRFWRNMGMAPPKSMALVASLMGLVTTAAVIFAIREYDAIEDREEALFSNGTITYEAYQQSVKDQRQDLSGLSSSISLGLAAFAFLFSVSIAKMKYSVRLTYYIRHDSTTNGIKDHSLVLTNEGETTLLIRKIYMWDSNDEYREFEVGKTPLSLSSMYSTNQELTTKMKSAYNKEGENTDIIVATNLGTFYAKHAVAEYSPPEKKKKPN